MKSTIKRFFAITLLAIGMLTNTTSAEQASEAFLLTGEIIATKIKTILDPKNTEVKEWKAWVQEMLSAIPDKAKANNQVKEVIKALEKVQKFRMIDAIGAFLKNNKQVFPPNVVSMVETIPTEEFRTAMARKTGKKI